jgi:hypothetical protein
MILMIVVTCDERTEAPDSALGGFVLHDLLAVRII